MVCNPLDSVETWKLQGMVKCSEVLLKNRLVELASTPSISMSNVFRPVTVAYAVILKSK